MPDATSTLQRVISDRHFFGKSLSIATVVAVASSTMLIGIVLCVGGIAQLVFQGQQVSGLICATTVSNSFPHNLIGRVVVAVPPLHDSVSALTLLFVALASLVVLRALLHTFVERRINRQVGVAVGRLREHIHRQALRSNPGDLTGVQRSQAGQLFHQTAQKLEGSARAWGLNRLTACCDLIVLVLLVLAIQWKVGIECLVPVFLSWYVARVESERNDASAHLLTEQVDRGLQRLTSDLNKAQIVAGYGMERLEHEHFSGSLTLYQERCSRLYRQEQQRGWTTLLIGVVAVAVPGFILARHVIVGSLITVPAAIALATVVVLMFRALRRLQLVPGLSSAATVAAEEINQYLLRVPGVSQIVGARFLEPLARILQFDQVTVETEAQPELLANLDLKIEAGERTALLSLNALEAEALINLVVRFNDPVRGQVLIDGKDIRTVTLESLRAEAVIVRGDEPPFNTTIVENITAGQPQVSRQEAIEASKLVHAESFIRQLPKGYETDLGEHNLSEPGQRFRLSLARAIARNPALLIIQEPEAAMDAETKAMLDDTYQRICNGRTVLFLPTRLSTVKKCNRVVMIHQGRVAEDGPHEQLVRSSELYRHWEYMRFNTFRSVK